MDYGLTGRTIVVTGAARGQGAAEAEILVREGARVIGADILDDEGKALAGRLAALGPGTMEYRHLDVSSESQWADLAAWLSADGGLVHGLVNNAGGAERPLRALLHGLEVGAARADQGRGARTGRARHPGQHRAPRADRHPDPGRRGPGV